MVHTGEVHRKGTGEAHSGGTGETHRKGTGEAHRGVDITGEVSRFNATPPRSHCAFRIASFADKTTTIFFLKMRFSFASWSQGTETIKSVIKDGCRYGLQVG